MTLSKRIKDRREALGLSVFQLSLRTGIQPQTLRNWESGAKPQDPAAIATLADVFGTTTDFLISGHETSS